MISIHAPVKGATMLQKMKSVLLSISIHAPVKGATVKIYGQHISHKLISIHAPVKGATD